MNWTGVHDEQTYDFYMSTAQRLRLATNRPSETVEALNEIAIALSLDDPRVRTDRKDTSDFSDILDLVDIYNEAIAHNDRLTCTMARQLRPQVYDNGRRLAHIAFQPTGWRARTMTEMAHDGEVLIVPTYEDVAGLGFHNVVDVLLEQDIHSRVKEYYDSKAA